MTQQKKRDPSLTFSTTYRGMNAVDTRYRAAWVGR